MSWVLRVPAQRDGSFGHPKQVLKFIDGINISDFMLVGFLPQ